MGATAQRVYHASRVNTNRTMVLLARVVLRTHGRRPEALRSMNALVFPDSQPLATVLHAHLARLANTSRTMDRLVRTALQTLGRLEAASR